MKRATQRLALGHLVLFAFWVLFLFSVSEISVFSLVGFLLLSGMIILHYSFFRMQVRPWKELEKGLSVGFEAVSPRHEEVFNLKKSWLTKKGLFEEELQKNTRERAQLQGLTETMTDGLITLDSKGVITSLNSSAHEILSLSGNSIEGTTLSSLLRSNELDALLRRMTFYKEPFETELLLYAGTLQEKTFQVKGSLFLEVKEGQHTLVVFTDVTQLRRLELVRRDFVANVSHELKTPLTSVKGYAETLLNLDEIDGVPRRFIGKIANNAERLHQIIEDLLVLSSLEQDGIDRDKMEQMSIKVVFDNLRGEIKEENLEKVNFQEPQSGTFLLHGPLLHLAIFNLIENAIKYSKTDVVEVRAEVFENGGFGISIRDEGVGIPREHLPHIMERFYRVEKARSRENGGTGLGLSIVKTIIEAHGGKVQVESEMGKGTLFQLSFPSDLNLTNATS